MNRIRILRTPAWWTPVVALTTLALAQPAAAVGGAGAIELLGAFPVGSFARAADATAALSMWAVLVPDHGPVGWRGEFHVVEEHLVANDVPDPFYVPAGGTTRQDIPFYTDIAGLSTGPVVMRWIGRFPLYLHACLGSDDIEVSEGFGFSGPYRIHGQNGAPHGFALSWGIGGTVLFETHVQGKVGGITVGLEYLGHPNASYLDRPPTDGGSAFRGTRGSADTIRLRLGFGIRSEGTSPTIPPPGP